ncbi:YwmB family TATA-box binding protein [Paenibacillus macerans]|uniref:YwmB family TATA-box binding protein n=1 Tax=Paenibacillus macerans TaxID=44252 RepID=UPI003D323D9B
MPNRKLWSFSLVILVCAVLLVGLQRVNRNVQEEPSAVNPAEAAARQLAALHAMGEAATEDPFQITVKWQGEWSTLLSPEEAAGVLSSRLGLSATERQLVQNHDVYGAEGPLEGLPAKLSVTAQAENNYYVVLRIESMGGEAESLKLLTEAQQLAGDSLADEGVEIGWNAALQGIAWPATAALNAEASGGEHALSRTLDSLERKIQALPKLKLKKVEGFADELTVSQSYAVTGLPITARSGDHQVALQLAVHRNAETGMDEIAIGSPLLTVEY